MDRADWQQIMAWDADPEVVRVQEWFPTGPEDYPQVFAVRYFKKWNTGWRELGFYIPLLQPEGNLQVFKMGGREWSEYALTRIGLI